MVRAGVVSHPEQWSHGGYNQIQHPRRKNILIDHEALSSLSGFDDMESFQAAHRQWAASELLEDEGDRIDYWTQSIATGSQFFVETVKAQMRSFATDRQIRERADCFELRESQSPYIVPFDTEKSDIGVKNLWFWNE